MIWKIVFFHFSIVKFKFFTRKKDNSTSEQNKQVGATTLLQADWMQAWLRAKAVRKTFAIIKYE